jgi:hypothetical protein
VAAALASQAAIVASTLPNPAFIVLVDQLDEATDDDWYCVDVAGTDVAPGNTLQLHTCKEPVNDELFETNAPITSNIYASDHNVCVTAETVAVGSFLKVERCSASDPAQRWSSTEDGQIRSSADETLCWAVSDEDVSSPAGAGGDHRSRSITLQLCSATDTKYSSWLLPGGYVGRRGP